MGFAPALAQEYRPDSRSYLFHIPPIIPKGEVRDQRNFELDHILHAVLHQISYPLRLVLGDFEEQLVMHLEDHAGAQLFFCELAVDRNHGQLDEVGGGAL